MEKEIIIPEGCVARIEGNKVVFYKKEQLEYEKMLGAVIAFVKGTDYRSVVYNNETIPKAELIKWLESQKKQTTVECSDEDKRIQQICEDLRCGMMNRNAGKTVKALHLDSIIESNIEWLESLSPQFKLKPIEPQITSHVCMVG